MGHTILLMTFLAGQSQAVYYHDGQSSGCGCQQAQAQVIMPASSSEGYYNGGGISERMERRPGLINRFRDWFGKGDRGTPDSGCGCQNNQPSMGMAAEHPMMMPQHVVQSQPIQAPVSQTREPDLARPISTAQFRPSVPGAPSLQPPQVAKPSKINPKFINKVGHEDDFSWITGQIDREGSRWILRYASADTVDRFHGELIVAPGLDMGNLRSGDLVSVTGQVMGAGSNGAHYRALSINLIERE